MNNIADFITSAKNSFYSKHHYSVGVEFDEFYRSLSAFTNRPLSKEYDNGTADMQKLIDSIYEQVPPFQRKNDKWSLEMQQSYVSNIIQGYESAPLLLYVIGKPHTSKSFCKILDGLQRITAILEFFINEDFKVTVGRENKVTATSKELLKEKAFRILISNLSVQIRVYEFSSEIEAIDFYIAMNENITHSEADIRRAKEYRDMLIASSLSN